ncbi:MAG: cation diffusion facilitator family transporter [Saprospiraceae bacterium]|nr:cation diffusion facilitator family transporter [Saprospiraceae bacterium]
MSKKVKAARLSILSNTLLIIIKVVAGIISGSVSIISEAIHSGLDLVAAIIAYISVRISDLPPDREHPYGHGKYENLSGVIEALLILVAAIWIIYEAIHKIIEPGEIDSLGIGIFVMFISAIVNFFVSRRLYKVAIEADSIALEADALHLKTDVYTSAGVGFGILFIWIADYFWKADFYFLDPIIAILVALLILKEAFNLFKRAFSPLMDYKLPDDEIEEIKTCICNHCKGSIDFHNLRSRKAGHLKYVDFHLEVPANLTVEESHNLCDKIEKEIESKIKNIEVTIHIEPFEEKDQENYK